MQILINLISNSIKFSNDESIIRINLQMVNEFIYFKIEDQGSGIKEEK